MFSLRTLNFSKKLAAGYFSGSQKAFRPVNVAGWSVRHMASGGGHTNVACSVGSPVVPRPDHGPTERINLVTAINQAMHCALETDPT